MKTLTLTEAWSASTHLLAERLLVLDWDKELPWHDVAPEELEKEKHLLPAVIGLDELSDEQRQLVQDYLTEKNPPAMLLHSDMSTEALTRRLAQRVVITLSDGSRALLRFADPRAFVHMLWVLPVGHFSALYDGINQWFFPFQEQWRELEFGKRPEGEWGPLDAQSSNELLNIGLINDTLKILPASRDLSDLCARGQKINDWLNYARNQFALTDQKDCVAFAQHGMCLDTGFTRHRVLAQWLQESVEAPGFYARQTTPLTDNDWKNIAFEIRRNEQNEQRGGV